VALPLPVLIFTVYTVCYLLGAVNFSLIAARIFMKQDLRKIGSGNAGFTNLLRMGNTKVAFTVLFLDIARGWSVLWICMNISMNLYWPFMAVPLLFGNLFPVFHRFKGGKGIAASIGIILAICPAGALTGLIGLLILISLSRRVSAGSLSFLISATTTAFLVSSPQVGQVCTILVLSGLWTHRDNIRRLMNGTEPPLSFKK
jgi:acyl phosphate:glycerol-3-phosphate acyltransferase